MRPKLFTLVSESEEFPYQPAEGVTIWVRRFDGDRLGEIAEKYERKFRTRTGQWERRVPDELRREHGAELLDYAIVRWEGLGSDADTDAPCTREWKQRLPEAWKEAIFDLARGVIAPTSAGEDPTPASERL